MGSTQQFCLKWNNHQSNMLAVFDRLLSNTTLVDVTLGCEGKSLKAHKVVLSACSPFFESLFADNPCKHPIVILKDIRYVDLRALVQFMYRGEVNVSQEQLPALLKTAEALKIKGLAEVTGDTKSASSGVGTAASSTPHVPQPAALAPASLLDRPESPRRKRQRLRHNSSGDCGKSDSEADVANSGGRASTNGGSITPQQHRVPVDAPDVLEDGSMDEDSGDEKEPSVDGPPVNHHNNHHGTADDDDEGEDFEPSKLLEQSMTENFAGGHDSSSAGGESENGNNNGRSVTPTSTPNNLIVPSDSSLDIKPVINYDDASGDSTSTTTTATSTAAQQAAVAALAAAAVAGGTTNPLMFVNNPAAAAALVAASAAGPSANAAGSPATANSQQSHDEAM